MDNPIFIVMWVLSAVFTLLVATALGAYIIRSWQKIRAPDDDALDNRILDHLDQMQTQLYSMSERIQRMEQRMMLPPGGTEGDVGDAEAGEE